MEKLGEEVDRVSALPDCLLIEILSRLPSTREAIKTGTLSKRWEHLWTWIPNLIFEDDDNHSLSDFVSLVDKTLTQCRQLKLKKFKVMFTSYLWVCESKVNNWIRYAIRCNVEELIMDLRNEISDDFLVDQFFFICACFTDLRLAGCLLNPTGAISWKNLKSLCIIYGKLDEDLIENILLGSPVLETLVLNDCYGFKLLNITSKSVKNLVFASYMEHVFDDLDNIIVINAPNILSLTIEGDLLLWNLLLVNVSSLAEAHLDYTKLGFYETSREEAEEEMLKRYLLNLRHIKELKLRDFCDEVMSRLEAKGFVFPSNMKFVERSHWCYS